MAPAKPANAPHNRKANMLYCQVGTPMRKAAFEFLPTAFSRKPKWVPRSKRKTHRMARIDSANDQGLSCMSGRLGNHNVRSNGCVPDVEPVPGLFQGTKTRQIVS